MDLTAAQRARKWRIALESLDGVVFVRFILSTPSRHEWPCSELGGILDLVDEVTPAVRFADVKPPRGL